MSEGVAQGVRLLAGRYELGELIGRGGMADVHVGMDTRLGRRVAVKLLKPSLANDPAFRTRFRREAQDAAKMAHPTIVRIFDAGEESIRESNGAETLVPFIVMEYVDGRLLKDVLADGPLEPAEATRIISQVLTALEYSHRAGVVHRDIKPGNIMITSSGQVKVMDFGIARAISESSATIAESSAIVGTAQYFSPEQARGESVDARTDLYSTGIVLFELLTGRAPFRGDNPVAVAYQHVNSDPVAPSTLNPRVSPALDAVVLRALAKDRFSRYQSAGEFRADVEAAAAGEVPARTQLVANDFNATLFGVNPSSVAGSEATLRQLTVDNDERLVRTQSRPPVAWIWAGIASMVVIIAAVIFWTFNLAPAQLTANVAVQVPDVVGQTYADGSASLIDAGLVPEKVAQTSDTVPEGAIISTDPAAGITVNPGLTVTVYVSLGETPVTVPNVANMTEADAIAALQAKGLKYGSTTQTYSASVRQGVVIDSDPPGGSERVGSEVIRIGHEVNLIVSNGLVQVPDVTGKSIAEASSALNAIGLNPTVQVDQGCSGGTVASQSIVGDQPQKSPISLRYCGG
ncbi:MAG: Stk1 family PASTA domain-containing Ser/Thr kinase [Microbacteriaceae bacterium]|nr:Stk1 family PASTA domain-containing Ser/Thr kinase [Actinomycetota bacterium]MCC6856659.1 Stk1 family PASTA domain-containing Ser/Thr kinase [Microbacteriaceae bacterium]HOB56567.1 Stk1 family PASTA domain-containing Ser/Thr kinase [Rhodoglobus sp.]HQA22713.1 Stk1 family PASTA domain-containing Ser/Thr kinase [Rhodoglobus sp.]HQE46510.1 Stk1 family PASTA domain-containing Ser/Thr kinase [Rhodoglobus sp.]